MKTIEIKTPINIKGTIYLIPIKALKLTETYCLYNMKDYKIKGICKDTKGDWRIGVYITKDIWFLASGYNTKKEALADLDRLIPKIESAIQKRTTFNKIVKVIKGAKEWKQSI